MRRQLDLCHSIALALFAVTFLISPHAARAQYMYLDANGDGVRTAADQMNANGVATTVDVWVKTNLNRDGSPGACSTADGPLTLNSYVVNLAATGGTVTYTGIINQRPEAGSAIRPFASNTTEMTVGWGGAVSNPPGAYRLLTVTITGTSGAPSIAIVRGSGLQAADVTSFGSQCSGNDFDNTLKLGGDWFDVDGLAPAAQDAPPVITAPATIQAQEFQLVTVTGSATDPNGDQVTLSQTNNAAFLAGPSSAGPSLNPSITLSGTPNFSQSGSFTINWSAVDNGTPPLTSTATTAISIGGPNRNPVITVPFSVSGTEGSPISITATAADPDGQNVTLCVGAAPPFVATAMCAGPSLNPSLTITFTPGPNDAGSYSIQWTATDTSSGTSTAFTAITIANSNRPPTLDQPADMTVGEGALATQQLTASDPDNQPLTFSKVGPGPLFMSVSQAGVVTLAPSFQDAGPYVGTVRVSDGAASDQKSFQIMVVQLDPCPSANAGGPYSGVVNVAVSFDGGGSSDPDGDALTYVWGFGDGSVGSGVTTTHVYTSASVYTVTLTVSDGLCSVLSSTTASIAAAFTSLAFTTGGNKVTSLGSGKPFTCVQVEPVAGAFNVAHVDLASIRMVSAGTGSVSQIAADAGKTTIDGDKNGDGLQEIRACFRKADLRLLFGGLPGGRNTVTVQITGSLVTGGAFTADLTTTVKSNGGALAASISPNPLNPSARVTFVTSRPGAVRVQVFDLNGRLVRALLEDRVAPAGWHDLAFDGRGPSGNRLTSGIYFVRIQSEFDGEATKSLTILK